MSLADGRPAALAVANWLVLYVRGTGAQVQLNSLLEAQAPWTRRFDRLQEGSRGDSLAVARVGLLGL